MKGKVLLGLSLVALATSNAFAVEIYKGKLVSHKETTTGNAKVSFKETKIDLKSEFNKLRAKKFMQRQDASDDVVVRDSVYDTSGVVGGVTEVVGTSQFWVYNGTDATQTYVISTNICAGLGGEMGICGMATDVVQLYPQGYATVSRVPMLTLSFDYAGSYESVVATTVHRVDETTNFSSYDYGQIDIFDAQG